MKTLRFAARMLARRWLSWLGFEFMFQVLVISLAGPGVQLSVDGAMALLGYAYLTWENIASFILSPVVIVLLLVWATLLALASVFNLSGLHYILTLDESHRGPCVQNAVRYAAHRTAKALRPKNAALVPFLLLLLPFVQVGTTAGVVSALDLPEFIMEYVETNLVLGVLYLVVMLALTFLTLRFVFTTVFFVADDEATFSQAVRKSRLASKHHALLDMLRVILVPAVVTALVCAVVFVPIWLIQLQGKDFATAVGVFSSCYVLIGTIISPVVSYATCFTLLVLRDQAPASPKTPAPRAAAWVAPVVMAVVFVASVAGGTFFVYKNVVEPANVASQIDGHKVEITAHRGGAFAAPENTMAAFKQAKLDGADVCELDVQQSSDGVIFVSHDTNFLRVSGVDKNAWELTWDEIRQLDATGDYWSGRCEKQTYPSLDEVIAWSKENGMKLNIELKPTGHETDFEKAVVDIVHAHDFGSQCVVTSQVYDTVKRVKECDSSMTCVYVMTLAYGEVWRMEAADAFSVEAMNATPAMVASLHERGKDVYAWVVNSEVSANRMVVNGVDNVITDDVALTREVLDHMNAMPPLERWLNTLAALLA